MRKSKKDKKDKKGKKRLRGGLSAELVPIGLTLINMLTPGKGYFNQRKTRNYLRWPGTTPWETKKHKNWSRRGTRGFHTRRR
jgi:hypothetical protein